MMDRTLARRLEYAFLIAGFIGVGYVGATYGRAYLYQSYENYQLNQTI